MWTGSYFTFDPPFNTTLPRCQHQSQHQSLISSYRPRKKKCLTRYVSRQHCAFLRVYSWNMRGWCGALSVRLRQMDALNSAPQILFEENSTIPVLSPCIEVIEVSLPLPPPLPVPCWPERMFQCCLLVPVFSACTTLAWRVIPDQSACHVSAKETIFRLFVCTISARNGVY